MGKAKNFIDYIKKYRFIIIILIIFLIIIFAYVNKNGGMEQRGTINIRYRVYTEGNGWSKWSKNGMQIGDKKTPITGIELETKKVGVPILYSYTDKIEKNSENFKKKIYGMRLLASYGLNKEHVLCYRSYNKKNKWLDWQCNMEFSGNIKEPITAIEIKIIPKNAARQDYLRDYNLNEDSSIGFNEVT